MHDGAGNAYPRFDVCTTGGLVKTASAPLEVGKFDQWIHLVGVFDGANVKIFMNGVLKDSSNFSGTQLANDTSPLGFFAMGLCTGMAGYVDETAIWSRYLSNAEVLQLYRRGANRNKFQFRTCTQSNCTDNPSFRGPDNMASTWFSELHNMTAVATTGDGSGSINLLSPVLDFTKWIAAVVGWAFNPSPAQYFQYRVLMESDDENNLCSGAPCMPDISSVTSVPAVAITVSLGRAFPSALTQFNLARTGDCGTVDDVRFQVSSDDGTTYKYWNGSAWTTVTTTGSYTQSANYTLTSGNIGTLASSGTFKFKALVPSEFSKTCELSLPSIRW